MLHQLFATRTTQITQMALHNPLTLLLLMLLGVRPLVPTQAVRSAKALATHVAPVRLLAGVCAHMDL
uniref:Putative secreted protein n=1 Tax=Anopheles triannulatus TaxID=58253 RepID=A0A2M4B3Q7_9DIPT